MEIVLALSKMTNPAKITL